MITCKPRLCTTNIYTTSSEILGPILPATQTKRDWDSKNKNLKQWLYSNRIVNCNLPHPGKKVEHDKSDKQMYYRHFWCVVLRTILILYETKIGFLKNFGRNAFLRFYICGACSAIKVYTDGTGSDWRKMGNAWQAAHVGKNCCSFWPPYILVSSSKPHLQSYSDVKKYPWMVW